MCIYFKDSDVTWMDQGFEILIDNQVLIHFFSKPRESRREARWLQTLGDFGIFLINLKPGKYMFLEIHFLELHMVLLVVQVLNTDFDNLFGSYDDDKLYGLI